MLARTREAIRAIDPNHPTQTTIIPWNSSAVYRFRDVVDVSGGDEIAVLAQTFDDTRKRLQQSLVEIEKKSREAEEAKARARTLLENIRQQRTGEALPELAKAAQQSPENPRYTYVYAVALDSLDAPLVAPGLPSLLNFTNLQPALKHGMHFLLYDNLWGTNFPMWYDENARFRFTLSLK